VKPFKGFNANTMIRQGQIQQPDVKKFTKSCIVSTFNLFTAVRRIIDNVLFGELTVRTVF
jgi:hypothetical protein